MCRCFRLYNNARRRRFLIFFFLSLETIVYNINIVSKLERPPLPYRSVPDLDKEVKCGWRASARFPFSVKLFADAGPRMFPLGLDYHKLRRQKKLPTTTATTFAFLGTITSTPPGGQGRRGSCSRTASSTETPRPRAAHIPRNPPS